MYVYIYVGAVRGFDQGPHKYNIKFTYEIDLTYIYV